MNMTSSKFLISATVAGLLLGGVGCRSTSTHDDEHKAITIERQPKSKLAKGGETVQFETEVRDAKKFKYHWFLNCNLLDAETAKGLHITGQDGPTLTITNTAKEHVGFYECVIERPGAHPDVAVAITEPAELMLYEQSVLTVYGTPIGGSGGGSTTCPPKYVGYVNFRKPGPPYGWKLSRPSAGGSACDEMREDTIVRYCGSSLTNSGCSNKCVQLPKGVRDVYRFTIFFPAGTQVSSGPYSIKLDGFDPN